MLKDINLYMLDMDGTIYLGETLFQETIPFLARLRDLGIGMILTEPPPSQLPLIDRLAQEYKIRVHIHNHARTNPWWDPAFMAGKVAACSEWIGRATPSTGSTVRAAATRD